MDRKEYKIYKIEDINDLIYIGKTKTSLTQRFCNHKSEYRNQYGKCSSHKLNLYNSICVILEDNLTEEEARERENYYIQNTDCVNTRTNHCDPKIYKKKYRSNPINIQKEKQKKKLWYEKNRDKILQQKHTYNKNDWYCSVCKCKVKLNHKKRHLETKKHKNNIL